MLKSARDICKLGDLLIRLAQHTKNYNKQMANDEEVNKEDYEGAILDTFIKHLIDNRNELYDRCEKLVKEMEELENDIKC